MMIYLRRVYDKYEPSEGIRILVDRLWPRGIRKSTPKVDLWLKDIGPSDKLRKWFMHDPKKWEAFQIRYKKELLKNKCLEKLAAIVTENDIVTFVYASKDMEHNNAIVLKEVIKQRLGRNRKKVE